jgi:hypothetical protein
MKRIRDNCREYGNCNITYKPSREDMETATMHHCSNLEVFLDNLFWLDTYVIGEEFCLSNYDSGCLLYNCYSDVTYILSFTELDDCFRTGKTLRLYARKIDDDTREYIEEWEGR